ncbi:MAG: STAS domain-containing protein [Phycisphaerae bacterium]|nr:STAS domain-containing protein [Phycisphaerae bacterium]
MAGQPLQVNFEDRGTMVVITPMGEISYSEATSFRAVLKRAADLGRPRIVVDLTRVEYMNSPGVATLVEALQNARRARARLILAGITPRVLAIFQIARLHTVFEIRDTLDAATAE